MLDGVLGQVFNDTFSPVVRGGLLEAVNRAYETAREHHDTRHGWNEFTFGTCVYHFAVHELKSLSDRFDEGVMKPRVANQVFRLGVGPYELACHRVGTSERDEIASSFPGNACAASRMVEQLWLPGVSNSAPLDRVRQLVLAHLGNPEYGFRAAYLCVPGRSDDGEIKAWAHTHLLWRADEEPDPDYSRSPAVIPDEVISESVVRKRSRKVGDGENR